MVQVYLFTMEPHLHANLRVLGQVCLLFRLGKKDKYLIYWQRLCDRGSVIWSHLVRGSFILSESVFTGEFVHACGLLCETAG